MGGAATSIGLHVMPKVLSGQQVSAQGVIVSGVSGAFTGHAAGLYQAAMGGGKAAFLFSRAYTAPQNFALQAVGNSL